MLGEKIYTFGDSITAGTEGGYVKYFTSILGADVTNFGNSGADTRRLVGIMTSLPVRDGISSAEADPNYADVAAVTIQIGTNNGVAVGSSLADILTKTIQDIPYTTAGGQQITTLEQHLETFPSTFHGNLALCIEYVKYRNEQTEIFLVTPPPKAGATDAVLRVPQALKELAEFYCVRFIDAQKTGRITLRDLARYSYDGIHLNALGNSLWGPRVAYGVLYGS